MQPYDSCAGLGLLLCSRFTSCNKNLLAFIRWQPKRLFSAKYAASALQPVQSQEACSTGNTPVMMGWCWIHSNNHRLLQRFQFQMHCSPEGTGSFQWLDLRHSNAVECIIWVWKTTRALGNEKMIESQMSCLEHPSDLQTCTKRMRTQRMSHEARSLPENTALILSNRTPKHRALTDLKFCSPFWSIQWYEGSQSMWWKPAIQERQRQAGTTKVQESSVVSAT